MAPCTRTRALGYRSLSNKARILLDWGGPWSWSVSSSSGPFRIFKLYFIGRRVCVERPLNARTSSVHCAALFYPTSQWSTQCLLLRCTCSRRLCLWLRCMSLPKRAAKPFPCSAVSKFAHESVTLDCPKTSHTSCAAVRRSGTRAARFHWAVRRAIRRGPVAACSCRCGCPDPQPTSSISPFLGYQIDPVRRGTTS